MKPIKKVHQKHALVIIYVVSTMPVTFNARGVWHSDENKELGTTRATN